MESTASLSLESEMPSSRLVIPLLNFANTTMFGIPKWHLSDDAYLCQIADDDFATLYREAEDHYVEILKTRQSRTICLNVEDPPAEADKREEFARSLAVSLAFVFNTFASGHPLIVAKAAYLDKQPESHHSLTVDLQSTPVRTALAASPFALRDVGSPEPLLALYHVVRAAIDNNPAIIVTLDRFNTSLVRANSYDQIIDITISLESVVQSSTEIRFRFSLYNSLIAYADPDTRATGFEMFQTLYDARSSIVHGDIHSKSSRRAIQKTIASMRDIQKAAVAVITYFVMYQYKKRRIQWKDHIERLALGVDPRVTD